MKGKEQKKPLRQPKKGTGSKADPTPLVHILLLAAVTFVALLPTLNNDFVNWDDIIYIMNNDMIREVSTGNVVKIFSSFWMGNYHPLTLISFLFDYQFFSLHAHGYHVHNLILHILNTVLVYLFCRQLAGKDTLVPFVAALLFGIHPMHVESVAWISERKDVLYTLYFFLSLITYVAYTGNKEKKFLFLSLFLFLLSLLAKAQAVTLPVVLVLIDLYRARKIALGTILEKIPFFLLALLFGIIAIYAQEADQAINAVGLTVYQSIFFGFYSICFYLFKLVLPVQLNCLYEYPFTASGDIPLYVYLSPLIIPLLGAAVIYTWKKYPYIPFGILFFLVTIFPVLQFLPVGQAVAADRYTYIPYAGLFLIAAMIFTGFYRKGSHSTRNILKISGAAVILVLALLTWNRSHVWKDSISLWTDVMEKNPKSVTAYVNRGYIYNQDQYKNYEQAIKDCNDGMKVDSNNFKLYVNRATAYRNMGRFDLAIADFTKSIEKEPANYSSFLDRGIMYTDHLGDYDKGIADFRVFLAHSPNHKDGVFNMGVAFFKKGVADSAERYCLRAIELSPENASAHYILAVLYSNREDFKEAYAYASKAVSLGFTVDENTMTYWRSRANIPEVKR